MAESPDKAATDAEEAYAAAAAEAKPAATKTEEAEAAPATSKPAPAAKPAAAETKAAKPAPRRKPARPKAPARTTKKPAAKARPARKSKPARKSAKSAAKAPAKTKPTVTQLKEQIMANAKTTDFTKPLADAVSDIQSKTKDALEKSTAYAGEITEFAKGNVEALVESGKVLSAGAQDMGKAYAEDAKGVYETLTADVKEMAAVKSPTELFQLQSKIARRNLDSMVALSSKTGEAMLKLYSDAFAPISGRVSLAAEKISKAA